MSLSRRALAHVLCLRAKGKHGPMWSLEPRKRLGLLQHTCFHSLHVSQLSACPRTRGHVLSCRTAGLQASAEHKLAKRLVGSSDDLGHRNLHKQARLSSDGERCSLMLHIAARCVPTKELKLKKQPTVDHCTITHRASSLTISSRGYPGVVS